MPSDVRSLLFGTKIASLYVQPHIGGDIALLTGIAKRMVERGAIDADVHRRQRPRASTTSRAQVADDVVGRDRARIAASTATTIDADRRPATPRRRTSSSAGRWASRTTLHGVENVQAIVNLALLRGMVGRPHAGLLPIRGHSQRAGHRLGRRDAATQGGDLRPAARSHFGVKLPTTPGLDTMACMEARRRGELQVGFCLGGNLYGTNPDADVRRARRSASST